jgi:hypothetical protein
MLKRFIVLGAATAALAPAATVAAKPRPVSFNGKTDEGTKISFVLDRGWVEQFSTLLPTTCLSVQGGTPHVDFTEWRIPFKYKLGATYKFAYGDPTKHYTITTRQRGSRIIGKLSMNFSLLGSDNFGSYMIWHCLATANFGLRHR